MLAWHNDRLHRSAVELEEYIEVCGAVPTHFVKAGPWISLPRQDG